MTPGDHTANTARAEVVLSMGSSAPDRVARLAEARSFLRGVLAGCRFTGVLESADYTGHTRQMYANCLCEAAYAGTHAELERVLKEYEARYRDYQAEEVAIDLDVVLFDGEVKRPATFRAPYFQYLSGSLR